MAQTALGSHWSWRPGARAGAALSALLMVACDTPAPDPISLHLQRVTAPAISSWARGSNRLLEIGPLLPVEAGNTFCMVPQYSSITDNLRRQGQDNLRLQAGAEDYVSENMLALVLINGSEGNSVQIRAGSDFTNGLAISQYCACSRTAQLIRKDNPASPTTAFKMTRTIDLSGDVSCRR